jgi:hypothetical protein
MGDDADRLCRSWLHGLSQDEEERGGVVKSRRARRAKQRGKEAPSDNA